MNMKMRLGTEGIKASQKRPLVVCHSKTLMTPLVSVLRLLSPCQSVSGHEGRGVVLSQAGHGERRWGKL